MPLLVSLPILAVCCIGLGVCGGRIQAIVQRRDRGRLRLWPEQRVAGYGIFGLLFLATGVSVFISALERL